MKIAMTTLAGLAIVAAFSTTESGLRAQSGRSVAEGVYTEEQAKRGEKVYAEHCAACHGKELKGMSDIIPSLAGEDFVGRWKDKTAGELFEKIKTTMPAISPGALTPEQTADSMAYMLSISKFPAGTTELPAAPEELKQIRIEAAAK